MSTAEYRPDVDGLRAVAVSLVLLFHGGLGFPGGFIGVDIFFVISGFLITGLVLRELAAGTFTFGRFWMRRIGRILPAAAVMVLVTLVAGFLLLLPVDFAELGESAIAQQLMLANVFFWRDTGYFEGPADMKPLLHTWSLAVEEQFYLGYPLVLVLLHRVGRRTTIAVLAALALASLLLGIYGTGRFPSATFFLLPTRAWELLLGGLLVFCPGAASLPSAARGLVSWASLAAIVGAAWCYDSTTPFPGVAALVPCLATATLILTGAGQLSAPGRMLASKPFVAVGLASYSLYLWHWPVLAYARYWWPAELPPSLGAVALLTSLGMAYLSYRFVEVPCRGMARKAGPTPIFGSAVASIVLLVTAGSTIRATGGFPGRLPETARRFLQEPRYRLAVERSVAEWQAGDFAMIGAPATGGATPDVLVWGDSHTSVIADLLDELAKDTGMRGLVASRAAVVPLPGVFNDFRPKEEQLNRCDAVMRFIRASGVRNVLLIADWQHYEKPAGTFALHVEGEPGESPQPGRDLLVSRLESLCDELRSLGVTAWIMLRVPCQSLDPRKRLAASVMLGAGLPSGISRADCKQADGATNEAIARLAERLPNVRLIDPSDACFDGAGRSRIGDANGSYYRDTGHLSPHGATVLLRPVLAPVFEAIVRER